MRTPCFQAEPLHELTDLELHAALRQGRVGAETELSLRYWAAERGTTRQQLQTMLTQSRSAGRSRSVKSENATGAADTRSDHPTSTVGQPRKASA